MEARADSQTFGQMLVQQLPRVIDGLYWVAVPASVRI